MKSVKTKDVLMMMMMIRRYYAVKILAMMLQWQNSHQALHKRWSGRPQLISSTGIRPAWVLDCPIFKQTGH